MLRRLYDWTMAKSASRHARAWLAAVAFLESSVFPIPPDALLLPMGLARRERALGYAVLATVASVAGALLGYLIGWGLWEAVGQPIIAFYGYEAAFARFQNAFDRYGELLVLVFGVTFFPFKVITIASGVVRMDIATFLASAAVARALRFLPEGWLLWRFGPPIRAFIERRLALLATAFVILLVVGFLLVGWGASS
ncbi:MAG: DedA family protein [Alphaproteobacteria bacterium]|nr:MAG: DedA family protein [Alphaproteobacteria bacterium]